MNIDWIIFNVDLLKIRAKMIVALGNMYGIENKTIAEVNKEAIIMILKEFERVIRQLNPKYKLGKLKTIYNVVDDLMEACYKQAKTSGEGDTEKEKWKLFFEKFADIGNSLLNEYMSRLEKFRSISNNSDN